MNHLLRKLAPISDAAWGEIEARKGKITRFDLATPRRRASECRDDRDLGERGHVRDGGRRERRGRGQATVGVRGVSRLRERP